MDAVKLPPLPQKPADLHQFLHNQDPQANKILKKFHMDIFIAIRTSTQDSFFKAISLAFYSTDKYNYHIRYFTAIWFGQNSNFLTLYPEFSKNITVLDIAESIVFLDFKINPGTIFAVVNAFNLALTSIYPPHNGLFDPHFNLLNNVFHPINIHNSNAIITEVCMLWVGEYITVCDNKKIWEPNGFVCCLPCGTPYKTPAVKQDNASCKSLNDEAKEKVYKTDKLDLGKYISEYKKIVYSFEFKNFVVDSKRAKRIIRYLSTNKNRALSHFPKEVLRVSQKDYFNFIVKQNSVDDVIQDHGNWVAMEENTNLFIFSQDWQKLNVDERGLWYEVHEGRPNVTCHPQPNVEGLIIFKVTVHHHARTRHFVRKITAVDNKIGGDVEGSWVFAMYEYCHLAKLTDRIKFPKNYLKSTEDVFFKN